MSEIKVIEMEGTPETGFVPKQTVDGVRAITDVPADSPAAGPKAVQTYEEAAEAARRLGVRLMTPEELTLAMPTYHLQTFGCVMNYFFPEPQL